MDENERLGIIYKKQGNELIPDQVILLDYDEEENRYIVKDPDNDYYLDTQEDFSVIECSERDIITGGKVNIKEQGKNSLFYLYIFDNSILEYYEDKLDSIEDVYHHLSRIAQHKKIVLNPSESSGFIERYIPKHIWRNDEIENMLYGSIETNDSKDFYDFKKNKINDEPKKIYDIEGNEINIDKADYILSAKKDSELDLLSKISTLDEKTRSSLYRGLDPETKALLEEYINRSLSGIDINAIIDEVSKKIIHQEEAIKTLATNIKFNQDLISRSDVDPIELDSMKVAILLDGATGTGKTAIVKDISSKLDIPIVITNANSFSETGYVGPTITDILRNLLHQTGGDVKKAERGIVFLDEIDKIASNNGFRGRDMKEGVQDELLTFISGGVYDIKEEGIQGSVSKSKKFDTSKLTFILAGAFQNLRSRKIQENKDNKNKLGFSLNDSSSDFENTYIVTPKDYEEEGLKKEFFGRIKVLVSTNSYYKEDLKDILLKSTISPLKNFDKVVKMYGYKGIKYDEEFIDALALEAYNMDTGARALQTIMSGIQNKLLFDIMNKKFDINEPIYLTVDLIDEYKKSGIRKY